VLEANVVLFTVDVTTHALLVLGIYDLFFFPDIFTIDFILLFLELSVEFIPYLGHYSSRSSISLAGLKIYILYHRILPHPLILLHVLNLFLSTCGDLMFRVVDSVFLEQVFVSELSWGYGWFSGHHGFEGCCLVEGFEGVGDS